MAHFGEFFGPLQRLLIFANELCQSKFYSYSFEIKHVLFYEPREPRTKEKLSVKKFNVSF